MAEISLTHGVLEAYVSDSNDVIQFKLIRKEEDIENSELEFPPGFTHQLFGESESIFGYKGLSIDIYYNASTLEQFYNVSYSDKISTARSEGIEPDNVLKIIGDKLEIPLPTNIDSFVSSLSKEKFRPYGKMIKSFEQINERNKKEVYNVYQVDMSVKGFREYHERMQTLLLWFIDAASYIDIDDEKWEYFVIYERVMSSGNVSYYFIGYATVYRYYAYPTKVRPRISQMLILPPFQKRGLGAELLQALSDWYVQDSDVLDITVEDPSESFVRLRDFVDCKNCCRLPSFSTKYLLKGFSDAMAKEAQEKFKICKRQARRVYEIRRLRCTNTADKRAYRAFRLEVKRRLNAPFQRQKLDMEKLKKNLSAEELMAASGVTTEQRIEQLDHLFKDLEAEYNQVIERLTVCGT